MMTLRDLVRYMDPDIMQSFEIVDRTTCSSYTVFIRLNDLRAGDHDAKLFDQLADYPIIEYYVTGYGCIVVTIDCRFAEIIV